MQRGAFITLEGGEGAGKSSQARLLKAKLETRGRRVVLTREPGGSPGAEEIRALLVTGAPERWTPRSETLLFLAARADHIARLIEPALAAGDWVVCDRFSDSTIVYQGIVRGLGAAWVRALHIAALPGLVPDLTLVLDLDPATGLTRAGTRANAGETRFENFDSGFHARLRQGFREIAASEPQRCALIDGAQDMDKVSDAVWHAVQERLKP